MAQAQGILSPTQFAALRGIYAGNQINLLKQQFDRQEMAPK